MVPYKNAFTLLATIVNNCQMSLLFSTKSNDSRFLRTDCLLLYVEYMSIDHDKWINMYDSYSLLLSLLIRVD